jgi:hypothetical protein
MRTIRCCSTYRHNPMQKTNKFVELCDGYDEIFAMAYDDPEGGADVLRELLKAGDLAREDLEDAALGLADAGMHKAARIVKDFAQGQPSEDDHEVCPWPEGSTNAKSWHAGQPRRKASGKLWREEIRRRKRDGSW